MNGVDVEIYTTDAHESVKVRPTIVVVGVPSVCLGVLVLYVVFIQSHDAPRSLRRTDSTRAAYAVLYFASRRHVEHTTMLDDACPPQQGHFLSPQSWGVRFVLMSLTLICGYATFQT